jgi:glycosyltransferase involved in cell wall biosynthesis
VTGDLRLGSVSVVIPAHNEETILRETVRRVDEGLRTLPLTWFEIIVSENGSRDSTKEVARELGEDVPSCRVLISNNADYGAAMRSGFAAARGDFVVNFDADYYDLSFVDAALRIEADIVVASKGLLGSVDKRILARRLISRVFGWLVRRLLGVTMKETHGIKLFVRASIAGLIPQVRSTQDLFDTELVARAERAGLTIVEYPIRTEEVRHSRTGILRRVPRTLLGLLRIRWLLRHEARPSVLVRN